MRCKMCGSIVGERQRFCGDCGAETERNVHADAAVYAPENYFHQLDAKWLATLSATPGLESALRKVADFGLDGICKLGFTGSCLPAECGGAGNLVRMMKECCATLDLALEPEVYLIMRDGIGAFSVGIEKPVVVVHYDAVGKLSTGELKFLLGREAGHIRCGHMEYIMLAKMLPDLGDVLGAVSFGIGNAVAQALEVALMNWRRKSELTADRAGYLCCGKESEVYSVLMKMSGAPQKSYQWLDTQGFVDHALKWMEQSGGLPGKVGQAMLARGDAMWTVRRAAEFAVWIESGGVGGGACETSVEEEGKVSA